MTQDSTPERRRKQMAFMDDKKGTQAMTAPEKIWAVTGYIGPQDMRGEWATDPAKILGGVTEYTRTDLSQAAIATAMMGAAVAAGNKIVEIAKIANPDQSVLRLQMLRVAMEKAVKASITPDIMAALAERERQVRGEALEKAALFFDEMFKPKIAAMLRDMKGGE